MSVALYDYQKQYLSDLPARSIMAADTGVGKTFMSLAHYEHYAKGSPLLILAPASKVRTGDWERDITEYFGAGNEPVFEVYSYERFSRNPSNKQFLDGKRAIWHRFAPKYGGEQWAVIADECLTGETLIQTGQGLLEIADITAGMKVLSYNHNTHETEYKRVNRSIKRKSDETLYILYYTGGAIISTYNHPHYVSGGYKLAKDIKVGEELYRAKSDKKIRSNAALQVVPEVVGGEDVEYKADTATVCGSDIHLRQGLWSQDSGQSRESKGESKLEQRTSTGKGLGYTQGERNGQTYLGPRSEVPTLKRWEREIDRATKKAVGGAGATITGLGDGIASPNDGKTGERLSDELQAGYRQRLLAYWSRSRWVHAQRLKSEMARPEEGLEIEPVRVERIEVVKRRNLEGSGSIRDADNVYCLEVEGNNNFFANGVLTHNCHRAKQPQSGISKSVYWAAKDADFFVGLSATPLPNGWIDFANYSKIWGFTKGITEFKRRYCDIVDYKGFPEIRGYWREKELKRQWQGISKRLTKGDALDLPDRTFVGVDFKRPASYMKTMLDRKNADGEVLDTAPALVHALRQTLTKPKLDYLADLIDGTDENIVIFYNYITEREAILEMLEKKFSDRPVIRQDGEKHEVPRKEEWPNIKRSVTVSHYKSGSTGVEMTYATQVVYFSPTYSYAEYLQSIGRVYRNGQTKKTTLYNFRTPNSVEEDIYTVLKTKNDFQASQWIKK